MNIILSTGYRPGNPNRIYKVAKTIILVTAIYLSQASIGHLTARNLIGILNMYLKQRDYS